MWAKARFTQPLRNLVFFKVLIILMKMLIFIAPAFGLQNKVRN